jgi:chromosome segregation ATPase
MDRLRRDAAKAEEEVSRLKKELDERDAKARDRESALDKLHAENRDLAGQLASQTQARLNLSDKLDTVQVSLKTAENELTNLRAKVADLEGRLSKEQRSQLSTEHQYRDQLTERNTLLLTVYQYLDKILGVEKTAVRIMFFPCNVDEVNKRLKFLQKSETKPFTNFAVFHDNLISRLKAVTNIQTDFDKKCKEAEARYLERLG